ncbi:chromatin-remodeling protein SPT16 [Ascoidea rubescens DSM 1968]|uniref:FACT complex subunit n=1 Tax=Ascoidea rubescens DSM 1968 TaxID=1344418 RepID=A0A1D2VFZ3_9ASCO|nr:global regulator of transcription [Ascoidea rubescens DSM 1968]ODV60598.1 global regulator of transcription [Ascoidea rubescens DSM 1968]
MSDQDIYIDPKLFKTRLAILQKNLSNNTFKDVNNLLFIVGVSDSDYNPYQKSLILQNYLLGYEFPSTLIFITKDLLIFVTSLSKGKYLKHLTNDKDILLWTRSKNAAQNLKIFNDLIDKIVQLNPDSKSINIGVPIKDKVQGKFINEWNQVFDKRNSESPDTLSFNKIDISLGLSISIQLNDPIELGFLKIASKSSNIMIKYFTDQMIKIVDDELKISHEKFSENIEAKIDDNKFLLLQKKKYFDPLKLNVDLNSLDWCYTPIIQSGGTYDLKPSAASNSNLLSYEGIIIASLGIRYRSYCANVARTFLIDPTKEMESNYQFLLNVQKFKLSLLKVGKKASEVYNETLEYIKKERPDLTNNFLKNCGWLTGLDFKDSTFLLNSRNERSIQNSLVFNLVTGFHNIKNPNSKSNNDKVYSLLLIDTVQINDNNPVILTDYSKNKDVVSFYFNDEEEDDNDANSRRSSNILNTKLRRENKNQVEDLEKIKRETQKKLHQKRLKEGLARFSASDTQNQDEKKPVFKRYESYVRESQIPTNVRDLRIHIDSKSQTFILPICGRPVPFHINAYKNSSLNEEGEYTYFRLNFNTPGGITSKKDNELPYEEGSDNNFVRSLTLRSKDHQRMAKVHKQISDLKKSAVKREQERKAMADVVEQANLIELNKSKVRTLYSLFVRPSPDSKRIAGNLQIHQNGLRYFSPLRPSQRIDILFSNIKHLFFQPCQDELVVLIHCHLKTPIMVGKKKALDIQFFREASDISYDETGGRKRRYRYGDEDELEQEQEERRRRAILDKEFKTFAETIAEATNGLVDLDIPFKELGFNGVPSRASVFCMPTRDCLVQLLDPPFLVITLEEIEMAYFERVQFGIKNFDLVFVFKDFAKPVVHINTIPIDVLEDLKTWLTDVDIPYSEGRVNLNWGPIMKTISSDPYQFFKDGGWEFLTGTDEDEESGESEQESEFQASDSDPEDETDSYSESEEDDYTGSSSEEASSSEEEEGEDWDELDRKAAKADSRRGERF